MDARRVSPTSLRLREAAPLDAILRRLAEASTLLLIGMAALLVTRRAVGAFRQPLGGPELLLVGAALCLAATGLRLAGRMSLGVWPSRVGDRLWRCLPASALLLFGIALSSTAGPSWALGLFWLMLVVEEGVWLVRRRPVRAAVSRAPVSELAAEPEPAPAPSPSPLEADDLLPLDVSQRITRSCNEQGESVRGLLRASFASGERSQSLHIAFCPPLLAEPRLRVEQLSGPPVALQVSEVRCYGARLDLRLPSASPDAVDVVVQFRAHLERAPDSA